MTIDKVIAALEKAKGPEPHLDAWIACLLFFPGFKPTDVVVHDNGWHAHDGIIVSETNYRDSKPYTSDINYAFHLIEKNQPWQICMLTEAPSGSARQPTEYSAQVRYAGKQNRWSLAHAATPALALCAAALMARNV